MDDTTSTVSSPVSLTAASSWERWVDSTFAWMPYVTLGASLVLAQIGSDVGSGNRLVTLLLTLVAAGWTWLTFTRLGSPTRIAQHSLWLYFVGFLVMAAVLVLREQVYLVYGVTGFLHASLLRPWSLAFAGMGATALVVHSHIVMEEGTASNWAIYLGVVAIQTVAVGFGLYFGERITEIAEERRVAVEQLELAMAENAGLHEQLVAQAREAGVLDERQRMAREIHDTIAQGLTGVITQIEAVHQTWGDEVEVQRHLDNASDLARDSLAEARRSVQAMRPAQLDVSRLPDALADVATQWSQVSGVPVRVLTAGDRRPLRPDVEVTLLRAAQEGLANVAKHAGATRVGVTLTFMDEAVTLDVRDDGSGFDPTQTPRDESYGLAAMRQRVERAHGVMEIESEPGEGTAISLRIPTDVSEVHHV